MSGGLLQYSGLVTKTAAMHGRLLTPAELAYLTEFETVEDFITFLRESEGYGRIYRSHEEIQHRSQVEAVIHNSIYADYMKLYRFANGEQRKGLEITFLRYEVNVLKVCLEYAYQGGGNYNLGYLNLFFARHSSYDTRLITQAKSLMEISSVLTGTPYENLFLRMQGNADLQYGDYAFGLDVFYYQKAWKLKDKLMDKQMKHIVTQILGTEIDWLNIMWMYRAKQFFKMKPVDISVNTIPVHYRLKKDELKGMLEAENLEEFMTILGTTAYFHGKDAIVTLKDEITFRHIMDKTYQIVCKKYPNSIASVLKYLYDKEKEIDALTTILEGIRYQLPSRDIREMY